MFFLFARNEIVWRDTTLQHFPITEGGSYEEFIASQAGNGTVSHCGDIIKRNKRSKWREEYPRAWIQEHAPDIPILALNETELHMYETYPWPVYRRGSLQFDCTHHVYTPLYYDSLFRRLAELLPLRYSSLPVNMNASVARR